MQIPQPKLLDQVRDRIRVKHYSIRTEHAYVDWIKRFIYFHRKRHPKELGAPEVEAFLTHLAVDGNVASSTQAQALSALLFLYMATGLVKPTTCHTFRHSFATDDDLHACAESQRARGGGSAGSLIAGG